MVYSNRYSSRGGSAEFVVEAGAMVREQQSIVKLPDPSRMQVKAKVSEGRITLVQDGMPVKIRVDAIPGLELLGRVTKVNRYAEPGGWFSSQIKEYAAIVQILNPPSEIRTGMTAEVRIFVDQRPDAVQIPVQGIYEHGGKTFTLVKKGNDFDTRLVSIAATNDTAAAIADGLEVGEQIVLDLRNHLNLMTLPTIERVAESKPLSELVEAQGGKFVPAKKGEGPSIGGQVDGPSRTGAAGGGTAPGGSVPGGSVPGAQRPRCGAGGQSGPPNPATIVQRTFDQYDADKDGKLSKEEIGAIPEERRARTESADTNKDGAITRAELMTSVRQRMAASGGQGGPGGGGPPGGIPGAPGEIADWEVSKG